MVYKICFINICLEGEKRDCMVIYNSNNRKALDFSKSFIQNTGLGALFSFKALHRISTLLTPRAPGVRLGNI